MPKKKVRKIERPISNEPRFIDTKAAAKHLCVSVALLEKYRWLGDGPLYRKFGRKVVYTYDDLNVWADQHPLQPKT